MVEARILIADDSKMNQQILSEILGVRYEYLYADDGLQALEHLHSEFDTTCCCSTSTCPASTASACSR